MELYARVRREVYVEGKSERQVAREYGAGAGTVRKMLRYSAPPGYRRQQPAKRPKLDPWVGVIEAILEEDRRRPRKQRHTAKRIHQRLREEQGFGGGYTIVKDYVRLRKAEPKGDVRTAGAPCGRRPGRLRGSAGGDRRRGAEGTLSGDRSAAVGRLFRDGIPGRNDGSVSGGAQSGVCILRRSAADHSVRNTKLAVVRILGDGTRKKTQAFSELQSHYLFQERFGRPSKGNDKGRWRDWSDMHDGTSWCRCHSARAGKS